MGLTLTIVEGEETTLVIDDNPIAIELNQLPAPVLTVEAPPVATVIEIMAGLKGDKGDPGTGGSGTGSVDSVNGVAPDGTGNVILAASDVGALADTYVPDWTDITSKPSTFTPSAHTHTEADVTGLTSDLALKAPLASPTFTGTVAGITKSMVGLGSVDNTSDATKAVLSATKLTTARLINGVSFDGTGNITINAVDSTARVAQTTTVNGHALSANVTVTASDVGLGNVNNTSDAAKPVSTAQQTALDGKAALVHTHAAADIISGVIAPAQLGTGTANTTTFLRGDGTWQTVSAGGSTTLAGLSDVAIVSAASGDFLRHNGTAWVDYAISKSDVGLSNVDNTADTAKPVSTAQQTALNLKADDSLAAHLAGTETLSGAKTFTGGLTVTTNNFTITDKDIVLGTTTGTKIGTATTQKLGFYAATPVIQSVATTDLGTVLSNLGLRAAGTAYPITTSGATALSGSNVLGATQFTNTMRTLLTIQTTATLTLGAHHKVLANATTQAITLTLPTALGVNGKEYVVEKIDATANTVTINTTAGQTIDGASTKVLTQINEAVTFVSDGTNWTIMSASMIHNHTAAQITSGTLDIARIPTGTTSTTVSLGNHTHAESDITNLTSDLAAKAPLASPTFTGTVSGITKSMVGLGSVDNTSDATKAVLSATKLTIARTINGVSFDGTANITVRLDQLSAPTAAVSMNSNRLTNVTDPSSIQDAATKGYVDDGLTGKADAGAAIATSQIPAGSTLSVHYTGSAWPARPTSRTDVTVLYYALTSSDPAPTDYIAGTDYLFQPV